MCARVEPSLVFTPSEALNVRGESFCYLPRGPKVSRVLIYSLSFVLVREHAGGAYHQGLSSTGNYYGLRGATPTVRTDVTSTREKSYRSASRSHGVSQTQVCGVLPRGSRPRDQSIHSKKKNRVCPDRWITLVRIQPFHGSGHDGQQEAILKYQLCTQNKTC